MWYIATEELDFHLPDYELTSAEWLTELVKDPPTRLVRATRLLTKFDRP